jgi:ribonuclease HI
MAELYAIWLVLEIVIKYIKIYPGKDIIIITDSEYACQAFLYLINIRKCNKLISWIRKEINCFQAQGYIFKFYWIKAHKGTSLNEMEDFYAKQAAKACQPSTIKIDINNRPTNIPSIFVALRG